MSLHNLLQYKIQREQRLIINQEMQYAFDVLQMQVGELSAWLTKEIEKNPLLEITPPKNRNSSFQETSIISKPTRYDVLLQEIREHFDQPKERKLATYIAGSLDEKGFLPFSIKHLCSLEQIDQNFAKRVLYQFQRMEPIGLATQGVQEALLVQLEAKHLQKTMLYQIIEDHFEDLLHQRFKKITQALSLSEETIKSMVHKHLRSLNPFPGHFLSPIPSMAVYPDITLQKEEDRWEVRINEHDLPSFAIHKPLAEKIENSSIKKEDMEYIRRHLTAGKWLSCILERRKKTLIDIMLYILKKQEAFLEGESQTPLPMTMHEIATVLQKSESTITRAIAHKYLECPIGFLKLRSLFTAPLYTAEGQVSNQKAKNLILKLIKQETKPLSDQELSLLLKKEGIPCARRTVTKYRKQLKISTASLRKHWN